MVRTRFQRQTFCKFFKGNGYTFIFYLSINFKFLQDTNSGIKGFDLMGCQW